MSLRDTALQLAELCEQKRAAYGDSIPKAAAALAAIYPAGIPVDQYVNALVFARVAEKHARVATGAEKHGEHPLMDAAGYGLMGWDYTREAEQTCQGSASGQNAKEPQKAQPASALTSTSEKTTPSADANSVRTSSPKPSESSANTKSASTGYACARTATEAASGREAVLAAAREADSNHVCAWCGLETYRFDLQKVSLIVDNRGEWLFLHWHPLHKSCAHFLDEALA